MKESRRPSRACVARWQRTEFRPLLFQLNRQGIVGDPCLPRRCNDSEVIQVKFVLPLRSKLPDGLLRPRFASLCQVRCAEKRLRTSHATIPLLPEPCVAWGAAAAESREASVLPGGVRGAAGRPRVQWEQGFGAGRSRVVRASVFRRCFARPLGSPNGPLGFASIAGRSSLCACRDDVDRGAGGCTLQFAGSHFDVPPHSPLLR